MPSVKISRYREDIKRVLPEIMRTVKDPRVGELLTVVKVDLTNDLSLCKVYISSLKGLDDAKESVAGLNSAAGFMRSQLNNLVPMRRSPKLIFYPDNTAERSTEIYKKLDQLKADDIGSEVQGDE